MNNSEVRELNPLIQDLIQAVEGLPGYGTLRNADGVRLKDHPAWVSLYVASNDWKGKERNLENELRAVVAGLQYRKDILGHFSVDLAWITEKLQEIMPPETPNIP